MDVVDTLVELTTLGSQLLAENHVSFACITTLICVHRVTSLASDRMAAYVIHTSVPIPISCKSA